MFQVAAVHAEVLSGDDEEADLLEEDERPVEALAVELTRAGEGAIGRVGPADLGAEPAHGAKELVVGAVHADEREEFS